MKTFEGRILTFHNVEEYHLEKGLLTFTDEKTKKVKRFPPTSCEVEEENENHSHHEVEGQ